jgi:PAS domain S-box-containing protein
MVRESLLAEGREDLVETAELLVSEIVTNALVHAGTPIDVGFTFVGRGLHVEVADGSPHLPRPRGYGPSAGTGRGLTLLEEMVDDWGVEPMETGKTVWFRIASGRSSDDRAAEHVERRRASEDVVNVALLQMPLLLHEAWRQHVEQLLREYLLASLDLETTEDPIEIHAQASDAIALLAEHIPPSGVAEDVEAVMITATEPLVTSPQVVVPVPAASVPHFATLERAVLTALEMVEGGLLLTPPTQPEVQGLRAWICEQVLSQSNGADPVPWSADHEPPPGYVHTLAWDTSGVRNAASGKVAADDEGRIVAISGPAVRLLGYDDAGQLLGSRLLAIIPARYQQAHLAAFSMHFLTGRSTLLGRRVVVPATRRDGTEVEVGLTIRTDRSEDGRTVFVADLEPAPG